jgi:chemotaxis signal transduction protein
VSESRPNGRARARATHLLGSVAGRLVAIELAPVVEVIPMLAIDEVPGGPAGLLGFADLSGEPVPVLSLRTLFGLPAEAQDPAHQIAICRREGRTFGLVLDEAHGLETLTALRSPTVDDRIVALEVVKAVGITGGRLAFVLEPEVVVDWLTRVLAPSPLVSVAVPESGAAS